MSRLLSYTPELGAQILGARRVGATLRVAARAAGVSWTTLMDWLKKGRAGDPRLEAFAHELDRAGAQYEQVLRARVMRGTEEDARLAFDALRWHELRAERTAKLRAIKAQAQVDEKVASGDLRDPLDELRSRLNRLTVADEARSAPSESDDG